MSSPGLETNLGTGAPACELAALLLPARLFSGPRFYPDFPSPPRFREGIRSNPYKNQAPTHSRKSAEKRSPLFSMSYKLPRFPLRSMSCVFCRLHTPGGGGHPPYACPMLATRRHPTRMSILRSPPQRMTKGHSPALRSSQSVGGPLFRPRPIRAILALSRGGLECL